MADQSSQQFLRELDKKLWAAADKLRANLDAAVYKHAVLGLIFLKYVSDSFAVRQAEIEAQLRDPQSDYFIPLPDEGSEDEYAEVIRQELEERDYYLEKNVFWVPALARWKTLQDSAKLPHQTEIEITNGKKTTYKITSTGKPMTTRSTLSERFFSFLSSFPQPANRKFKAGSAYALVDFWKPTNANRQWELMMQR